ncbi:POGZ [Branchiostoma lanceolatum]|uniref:POGZ protein n=1 Tax=Branchiostoma lanceolatum TaxID=7740 RepID=A0A8K0ED69_BRALA|nr:POGZ [Branchiostoma lanceolatum]
MPLLQSTNNDTKGYHTRLNRKAQHSLPFCLQVDLFCKEAQYVRLQGTLVSMNQLTKYISGNRTGVLKSRLFKLWEEYRNGERTTSCGLCRGSMARYTTDICSQGNSPPASAVVVAAAAANNKNNNQPPPNNKNNNQPPPNNKNNKQPPPNNKNNNQPPPNKNNNQPPPNNKNNNQPPPNNNSQSPPNNNNQPPPNVPVEPVNIPLSSLSTSLAVNPAHPPSNVPVNPVQPLNAQAQPVHPAQSLVYIPAQPAQPANPAQPLQANQPAQPPKAFLKEVRRQGTNDIDNFAHKKVGRPLKLGDIDPVVQEFVRSTRKAGGPINRPVVMTGAKGIVLRRDRSLLTEYGGHIEITKTWANSLLVRMNFVRRNATKAARKLPADFETTREAFLARFKKAVGDLDIPDDMVINWDQTGVNIVPVGDWTLVEAGARQVPVVGHEDKRQITLLLAISLSGHQLPPQVLYQGKTDACHARFNFPDEWDVFHTESHWSNSGSKERYVDTVVAPYMAAQREWLGLDKDHPGLAVFDVYKAHRTPGLLEKLKGANVKAVFVPASCTGELQPLDADGCVNDALKKDLTQSFTDFYAQKVAKALEEGLPIEDVKVDLRLSVMKPLHASWLLGAIDRVAAKRNVVARGWDRTGIRDAIETVR